MLTKQFEYKGYTFSMTLEICQSELATDPGALCYKLSVAQVLPLSATHAKGPVDGASYANSFRILSPTAVAKSVEDAQKVARHWVDEQKGVGPFASAAHAIGFVTADAPKE